MHLIESDYLPFAVGESPRGPWLVLVPHPDDETFGMGGSISRAARSGIRVDVIVLTDGSFGGENDPALVSTREREARAAAEILGIHAIEFWREPDRGLVPKPDLIERVAKRIQEQQVRSLFFPSITEPHPDHRATAIIGWEASRRSSFVATPIGYEISSQGPINLLLDVTDWIADKRRAMAVYASQEAERSYSKRIVSQNIARTWSLPDSVQYAEAFLMLEATDHPLHEVVKPIWERYLRGINQDEEIGGSATCERSMNQTRSEATLCSLQNELEWIKQSRSWQLTAPYRWLGGLIRRFTNSLTFRLQRRLDPTPTDGSPAAPGCGMLRTRPKLLVVLAANVIGGAELQTYARLTKLSSRFDVVLVTHKRITRRFGDLPLKLVEFENFGLSSPYNYGWRNVAAYGHAISRIASDQSSDIVYAVMHNSSLFIAAAFWLHPWVMRKPVLVGSLHGSFLGCFEQRSLPPTLVESATIRMVVKSMDAIVTPSRGVANELVDTFGAKPDRVHPIYNGHDLQHIRSLARQPLPVQKDARWVLTCCRLSDQKDFGTLLKGFSRIKQLATVQLIILGEGPERDAIDCLIHEFGLAGKVLLPGFQSNPFAWIRLADVFVLSSFYEGFGNVIVEAFALGVPVVASDCPWGPSEIIESGISGYLFKPGDASSLASHLDRLLEDESLRQQIGEAALIRSEHFSLDRMATQYMRLFDELS